MNKILSLIVVLLLATGCINDPKEEITSLQVGDKIPAFSVTLADGSVVSNLSLVGEPFVLCFFRTTCPDCQQEFPALQSLHESFPAVTIVMISSGQSDPAISDYWDENGLTLSYSAQADKTLATLFGVSRIPQVYICDADGVVRYMHDDNPVATYDQLSEELKELLN